MKHRWAVWIGLNTTPLVTDEAGVLRLMAATKKQCMRWRYLPDGLVH